MAAVTICSDFRAQEKKICHCLCVFPLLFAMKWWDRLLWSSFFECWVLSQLFTLPVNLFQRLFIFSSLSAIRVVPSAYLRLLIFLLAILISACDSSSLAFCLVCSAYKLNKWVENIQPWCTPFPNLDWSMYMYMYNI